MEMIPVRSRAITPTGYDPATYRMKITFKQSNYDFCGVPAEVYRGLTGGLSDNGRRSLHHHAGYKRLWSDPT
uniref:KTSC domain-containing protein n=1 Tax=Bordetella sputigena TaxID=1416810 RepID=UPI0039EE59DA